MAILLSGLHYFENYNNTGVTVDFRKYVKNIKTKIYEFFQSQYHIDTFLCTNSSVHLNHLLDTYKPVEHVIENEGNMAVKKTKGLQSIFYHSQRHRIEYEIILLTRFDIYFLKEFTHDNIHLHKLNIISILEHNKVCDDNLFILPWMYLKQFTNLLYQTAIHSREPFAIHYLKNKFEKMFQVHYIYNEHRLVADLSFFKLRFFENIQFILNEHLFSYDVVYSSIHRNADLIVHENGFELFKKNHTPCSFAWAGYNMRETGYYTLSFDMWSDKQIVQFPFIKLHQPVIWHTVPAIHEKVWTHVTLFIHVTEPHDLMCFMFDEWNDTLHVQFQNVVFYKNGIILNKMNIIDSHLYCLNHFRFKKIDTDTFEIIKDPTDTVLHFTWFGYFMKPTRPCMSMTFDIFFLSPVPQELFFIKSHEPVEKHDTWLRECVRGTFVTIHISFHSLMDVEQYILFMMDEYHPALHFIVRNISFS